MRYPIAVLSIFLLFAVNLHASDPGSMEDGFFWKKLGEAGPWSSELKKNFIAGFFRGHMYCTGAVDAKIKEISDKLEQNPYGSPCLELSRKYCREIRDQVDMGDVSVVQIVQKLDVFYENSINRELSIVDALAIICKKNQTMEK